MGPAPIPVDEFSLPKLVDAIKFMLDPKVILKFFIFFLGGGGRKFSISKSPLLRSSYILFHTSFKVK